MASIVNTWTAGIEPIEPDPALTTVEHRPSTFTIYVFIAEVRWLQMDSLGNVDEKIWKSSYSERSNLSVWKGDTFLSFSGVSVLYFSTFLKLFSFCLISFYAWQQQEFMDCRSYFENDDHLIWCEWIEN